MRSTNASPRSVSWRSSPSTTANSSGIVVAEVAVKATVLSLAVEAGDVALAADDDGLVALARPRHPADLHVAAVLHHHQHGLAVPDRRQGPGVRRVAAVEGAHPAPLAGGDVEHADRGFLRLAQRVVGPDEGDPGAVGRPRAEEQAGVAGREAHRGLTVEPHREQVVGQVEVPGVVGGAVDHEALGVGRPARVGELVLARCEVLRRRPSRRRAPRRCAEGGRPPSPRRSAGRRTA